MKTQANAPINVVTDSPNGPWNGLTKREYFAALAMQGVLSGHYEYFTPEEISRYAIINADFLINALNRD